MGGLHQDLGFKVPGEQRALLGRQHYTLRPLSSFGALSPLKVADVSWQPILIFILLLLAQTMIHSKALTVALLVCLLIFPAMELLVLLIGVAAAVIWRGVRWKAVLFWMWWPFWKMLLCTAAACTATAFGGFLWNNSYSTVQQIEKMQVYENINPLNANVTGLRLQDAGVVTFDAKTGVNRMMTGCFVDSTTFCIAAITSVVEKDGGKLPAELPQYELFMTGTDCCECPGEFRCGDWNVPGTQLGGFREPDAEKSKFYTLASRDFAASYHKVVQNPIFLQWHNEPLQALHDLSSSANSNRALAIVVVPFVIVAIVVVLNGLLQLLIWLQMAGPQKPPTAEGMIRRMGQKLLPSMYNFQREEQEASLAP